MPHVLIAEDDSGVRRLVGRILSSVGWSYGAVSNGQEALRVMEAVIPDVVLADIDMPGMDGLELTKAIKADPLLYHIPVVLMSGRVGESEALQAGSDAFIIKPFSMADLMSVLRRCLSG